MFQNKPCRRGTVKDRPLTSSIPGGKSIRAWHNIAVGALISELKRQTFRPLHTQDLLLLGGIVFVVAFCVIFLVWSFPSDNKNIRLNNK